MSVLLHRMLHSSRKSSVKSNKLSHNKHKATKIPQRSKCLSPSHKNRHQPVLKQHIRRSMSTSIPYDDKTIGFIGLYVKFFFFKNIVFFFQIINYFIF